MVSLDMREFGKVRPQRWQLCFWNVMPISGDPYYMVKQTAMVPHFWELRVIQKHKRTFGMLGFPRPWGTRGRVSQFCDYGWKRRGKHMCLFLHLPRGLAEGTDPSKQFQIRCRATLTGQTVA